MRRVAVLAAFILVPWNSRAQPMRFQHLTAKDGLSDNAVTCIFEDRTGHIWIGTERGLNRYDGQRVERFMAGPDGPAGDQISAIAEDAGGGLWITTVDGGLSRRDARTGRFTHFRHVPDDPRSIPTDQLNHVLVLRDSLLLLSARGKGAIWFHTGKGTLFRRGYRSARLSSTGDTLVGTADNWCNRATLLSPGRVLLSFVHESRSCIADAETGEPLACRITPGPITQAIHEKGRVLMGGWTPGIHTFDTVKTDGIPLLADLGEVSGLLWYRAGTFLAATRVNGLVESDTTGRIIARHQYARSDPSSLLSDRTTCLFRDRGGNVWVGTAKGVSIHAPSVWNTTAIPLVPPDEPGDLVFHRIQQDADGAIRISTSKGFVLLGASGNTSKRIELKHAGIPLEVTGLFRTGPNEWFVGTETGLFRYQPGKERILTDEMTGKWASTHAGVMCQVREAWVPEGNAAGSLILGALGYGHIAIDRTTGKLLTDWTDHWDALNTMMLRATVHDGRGTNWSATAGGVVHWATPAPGEEPGGLIYSTRAEDPARRLPSDDVTGLAMAGDTVWAALRDAGIARFIGDLPEVFAPPAHMPKDILGVAVDRRGYIWCTTGNGLLRLDPGNARWAHVPINDGGSFQQLTKCIITLKDGRLAFCADDHLLVLDPRSLDKDDAIPIPVVSMIGNTWGPLSIGQASDLELPYRNSSFDVTFSALRPTGAAPLVFLCRLDTEEPGYREVTAREPLRYSGVPVGSHRLLVRVRDAFGREGPEHELLTIRVAGPFWQQWWFFLLVLLTGAVVMFLVSRFRQRQRARLQGVRDRIARDLHDDIGSTLGSISFYSEALKRKLAAANDPMARQVAERIGVSSREMIDQMSDIVWSVDPKHDDAGALGERIQGFATDLLAAKGIALDLHLDPALAGTRLSADQRRNLFLICKELLHNTVKYADARTVVVRIATHGASVHISIEDDGKGFDPGNTDSYNGNGLPNMRARAAAIGADLQLESAPGKGAKVRIRLSV